MWARLQSAEKDWSIRRIVRSELRCLRKRFSLQNFGRGCFRSKPCRDSQFGEPKHGRCGDSVASLGQCRELFSVTGADGQERAVDLGDVVNACTVWGAGVSVGFQQDGESTSGGERTCESPMRAWRAIGGSGA